MSDRRLRAGRVASLPERARRVARPHVREKGLPEPRDARAAVGAGRAARERYALPVGAAPAVRAAVHQWLALGDVAASVVTRPLEKHFARPHVPVVVPFRGDAAVQEGPFPPGTASAVPATIQHHPVRPVAAPVVRRALEKHPGRAKITRRAARVTRVQPARVQPARVRGDAQRRRQRQSERHARRRGECARPDRHLGRTARVPSGAEPVLCSVTLRVLVSFICIKPKPTATCA